MVWVRFMHFPPLFEAYEHKMARSATSPAQKFSHPEATIRPKGSRGGTGGSQRR